MPHWHDEIRRRLESLRLSPTREAEIVEEVAQHCEDRYRELRAAGASEAEARAAALKELDRADVFSREVARVERPAPLQLPPPDAETRGGWARGFVQDTRYALRTMRKSRGFTFTVVVALALSIGPLTAIVSIGNWLLWRPLPGVTDAHRLAVVWFGTWDDAEGSMRTAFLTPDEFAAIPARATTASGVAGVQESAASLSFPGGVPRLAPTGVVTANFFEVLGVPLRAGRSFLPEEDRMPGVPVAIIGEGLARSAFGDPASALEKTILLNSRPFTIVGVASSAFRGTTPTQTLDVWIPGASNSYLRHAAPRPGEFYSFVMRVAPGRRFNDLENELNVLVGGIGQHLPARAGRFATVKARVFPGLGVEPLARTRTRTTVTIMLAIGAMLLLLGCANAANLLVFRATRREQEIAVRKALGASRARLVQVQLMEGVLLAACGAALGVALALGLKQLMQQLLFPRLPGMSLDVPIDARVLTLTMGAALVTGILAAAAPAWLAVRDTLVSLGAGGTRTSTRAPTLRGALASVQLALSLTLLVGALLLVTTLRNLRAIDLGFEPANLTAMWVNPGTHGFDQPRTLQYFREVLASLSAHGEFQGVALAASPYGSSLSGRAVSAPAAASTLRLEADFNTVTHDYFAVMRIPMLRGRAFTPEESLQPGGDPPVIVNATLAQRLYGTVDVIGRTLRVRSMSSSRRNGDLTIVGVAGDVKSDGLTSEAPPFFYQPVARADYQQRNASILVRSSLPAARVGEIANTIASRTNSTIPVTAARSLASDVDRGLSQERLFAWLLSLLGALGFVLASLGLYGLVAQTTLERRREFGIRMAIGAGRADIIRLVARYAFMVSAAGAIVGLGLAFAATRLVDSMLFGVSRLDPMIYVVAVGSLVVVVALACIVPTLRALRVQPVEVLRAE